MSTTRPTCIGRGYENGYGGRTDGNGNVIVPPVAVSGAVGQGEVEGGGRKERRAYPSRSVVVDNPVIYTGGANGQFGFKERNNNCTTYAAAAWQFYSGENPSTGLLWDDPDTLKAWIQRKNARAAERSVVVWATAGGIPGQNPLSGISL